MVGVRFRFWGQCWVEVGVQGWSWGSVLAFGVKAMSWGWGSGLGVGVRDSYCFSKLSRLLGLTVVLAFIIYNVQQ